MNPPSTATRARALPVVSSPTTSPVPMGPTGGVALEEELRTSDGVAGHQYSRLKGIGFCLFVVGGLPFLPLWPVYLAWDAKDSSLLKNYFGTLAYVIKTLWIHIAFGSFLRMLKYNIILGPEAVRARIAKRRGACTRCAKCCRQYNCIFLGTNEETKESYCKVYRSTYWYYGTCGRYPLDQKDIDDHACPGFSFEDSPD